MSETFKCEICEKEFDTLQKVSAHKAGAHKRKRDDSDKRKERIPVGIRRKRLESNTPTGKVDRYVNDEGNRLQIFLDGGYEFVNDENATDSTDDVGTRISKVVDKGTGKKAYLMRIDKELYDQDQAVKQARNDEIDDRIKHGKINDRLGDAGYDAGIKYNPKN